MKVKVEPGWFDDKTLTLPEISNGMHRLGWETTIFNQSIEDLTVKGVQRSDPMVVRKGETLNLEVARRRVLWGLLPWFGYRWAKKEAVS